MPSIDVLVGMVGSGKSTYARKRADEGALVICHDDLTQMIHGGAYRYEPGLHDCYRSMETNLALLATDAGRDVVVDRTHLTRESRARWIMAFRNLGIPVIAVAFPIAPAYEHATRRYVADSRGRPFHEWLKVVHHHAEQARLEPLAEDEGFDRIVHIDPEVTS